MSCSFVQMSNTQVREVATGCLARIENRNKQVFNAEVERRRLKYERSWFRRLFRLAVPTVDEIEIEVRADFYFLDDLKMYAWRSRMVANELLKAAECNDIVNVAVQDLDYLST